MQSTKPITALAAPLLLLGLALGVLLFDPFGIAATLRAVAFTVLRSQANGIAAIRPGFALLGEGAALAVLGAATLLLLQRAPLYAAALFVAVGLAALCGGARYLFFTQGWLTDAATPGLGLIAVFAAGALARLYEIRMLRADLRLAFYDSLPRASIEKIARKPELLTIAGEVRTVTYLVCGVRGLVALADSYREDPKGFTRLMQQVLSPLLDQVLAHGGTVDRLTADGFAAFWNAPLDDADHATHACEAANGMSIMAARVGEQIAAAGGPRSTEPVEIGVGIATGPAIAGGFGGHGRLGYSVSGHAVALAAQVQALSHQYGPAVIVADSTRKAAERGFAFLEVDRITADTENTAVTLYAMLGNPVVRSSPKFRALIVFHEHIFNAIRTQQWGKARELIEQCRKLSGASAKLYDLHLARIAWYEQHPPGVTWDGAFRAILN